MKLLDYLNDQLLHNGEKRITALCHCETEAIGYGDLQRAYSTSLIINRLGRILTEQVYILKTKREKDFLTKSAHERYVDLIAKRPDVLKFIPSIRSPGILGCSRKALVVFASPSFPDIC